MTRTLKLVPQQGETVLETLRREGVSLASPCGGAGTCGKCRVALRRPDGTIEEVLACQEPAMPGMEALLPKDVSEDGDVMDVVLQGSQVVEAWVADEADGFGLAIDVGTTTLACRLLDLHTGNVLASSGLANPQRGFGADVISRITAVGAGHLDALQTAVNEGIVQLVHDMLEQAGVSADKVNRVSLAGNTVMEHLACGIDPTPIGSAPFTPPMLFGEDQPLQALANLGCGVQEAFFLPCVAGYVGGDITADILSLGMTRSDKPHLLADLGTNGEMALSGPSGFICCATAAGPVFEGANITFGMPAYPGAISKVAVEDGTLHIETINGEPAKGICGSGLIDVLALLLDAGIVEESGLMLEADEVEGKLPYGLALRLEEYDGAPAFWVAPHIAVTQRDVRNVQLAKAAITAGIGTLVQESGLSMSDIARFDIAGGLGQKLNLRNAARVGLFPEELLGVARSVGNAAVEGAACALISSAAREASVDIAQHATYLELSTSSAFNERYLEAMEFPD